MQKTTGISKNWIEEWIGDFIAASPDNTMQNKVLGDLSLMIALFKRS